MIRVIIQEEERDSEDTMIHMVTKHESSSEDQRVIADFLRSVANKYDPPKPVTRSG